MNLRGRLVVLGNGQDGMVEREHRSREALMRPGALHPAVQRPIPKPGRFVKGFSMLRER